MKTCPYCAEEIQDEAIICRYCKSRLDVGSEVILPPIEQSVPETKLSTIQGLQSSKEKGEDNNSDKVETSWGGAIAIGILVAILASIPKFIQLSYVIVDAQNGIADALIVRSIYQDIGIRLLINSAFWTLAFAVLIWIWRKNKILLFLIVVIGFIAFFSLNNSILNGFGLLNLPTPSAPIQKTIQPPRPTITIWIIPTRTIRPTPTSIYNDLPNMNESQIRGYCEQNTTQYSLDSGLNIADLNKLLVDQCVEGLTNHMDSRK